MGEPFIVFYHNDILFNLARLFLGPITHCVPFTLGATLHRQLSSWHGKEFHWSKEVLPHKSTQLFWVNGVGILLKFLHHDFKRSSNPNCISSALRVKILYIQIAQCAVSEK